MLPEEHNVCHALQYMGFLIERNLLTRDKSSRRGNGYIPEGHDPLQQQTNHPHEPEEDSTQLEIKKMQETLCGVRSPRQYIKKQDSKFECLPKILISATALATATSNTSLKPRFCPKFCLLQGSEMHHNQEKSTEY